MDTKKIYLIRHGQTDFNRLGIVQGSGVDSSLNEQGRLQAKAFFEEYYQVKFDKVYTSVLRRSIESVKDFIGLGIPHEALAGFNEISWGTKEGQPITPEEDEYYYWVLEQWKNGNTALQIRGGESPEDVVKRMKPAVDYVFNKKNEKTILICMHGRAIRILLCHLLALPLSDMDTFKHENLGLYLLEYSGSKFLVKKSNDATHLRVLS